MRLELTRVGLLAELANHYTTRGASASPAVSCIHESKYESESDNMKETEKQYNPN